MSLNTPSPGAFVRWFAENGDEVFFRIALFAHGSAFRLIRTLYLIKHLFQAHDGDGFGSAT